MNIIIHIGTQKTATSSLQDYFLLNNKILLSKDCFYFHHENSKNANILASHATFGRYSELRQCINNAIQKSRRAGLDTILVSGESLYAMSAFFLKLHNKKCPEYWNSEKSIVTNLYGCIPDGIDSKIVCYFRRQDQFLESMYNQVVKSTVCYTGSINQFYDIVSESLDYAGHMDIWADVFGIKNIQARCYEAAAVDICNDFLVNVLGIENTVNFIKTDKRINKRVNRDVLEYKRLLNRIEVPPVEQFMTKRALSAISGSITSDDRYMCYLEPDKRNNILRCHANGNSRLQSVYNMDAFPEYDVQVSFAAWDPYPGLSVARSIEITMGLQQVKNRFRFKLEYYARNISYLIKTKIKVPAWVYPVVRKFGLLRFVEMP